MSDTDIVRKRIYDGTKDPDTLCILCNKRLTESNKFNNWLHKECHDKILLESDPETQRQYRIDAAAAMKEYNAEENRKQLKKVLLISIAAVGGLLGIVLLFKRRSNNALR